MRHTYRVLVEITVEAPEGDEFTSHDLAENLHEALGRVGSQDLVPHEVVIYQVSPQPNTKADQL